MGRGRLEEGVVEEGEAEEGGGLNSHTLAARGEGGPLLTVCLRNGQT